MSFGANKSKQKSASQSTSSTSLDPGILSTLQGNVADAQALAAAPYQPYTGQGVAGTNATQQAGYDAATQIAATHPGAGLLASAAAAATAAGGYQPADISGGQLDPARVQALMNPYTDEVVANTQRDMERAREVAGVANAARQTAAGAFGGTRGEVENAETNRGFFDTLATQIGQLRQAGYTQAQGAATSELDRALAAATTNQGAHGQAADRQLQSAGLLGTLSNDSLSQAQSEAAGVTAAGNAQHAQAQAELDWQYQNGYVNQQQYEERRQALVNQAVGLLGNPTTSTSQSTGSGSGSSFGISATLPK